MVVAAWAERVAELRLESGRSLREWGGGNVGTGTRENRGFLRVIATETGNRPLPQTELSCIVGINTLVAGPP